MARKITYCIFAVLLGIAIVARFFFLDSVPSGVNWDEAAYGYNAYSILQTGKDEWGNIYPLFLKSFGDYKPALLSYLQMPFIASLGLSATSIRIPMALLSIASLFGWYFILKHLTKDHRTGFIGAVFMAIAPWHFHYSRAAMDPMISFSFLLLGYAGWLSKKNIWQWGGVIGLILAMYTYNSARVFVPVLLILHYLFRLESAEKLHQFSSRTLQVVMLITATAIISSATLFTAIGSRASSVFVLNSNEIVNETNESLYRSTVLGLPAVRVFSNKVVTTGYLLVENYLVHFDPSYLFFDRHLSPRHGFSRHGNLLLIFLPFLALGLFQFNKKSRVDRFFLTWMLTAPAISALSTDVPHSGRTLIMLPAIIYFCIHGYQYVENAVQETVTFLPKLPRVVLIALPIVAISMNTLLYFRDLVIYFPEESHIDWQGHAKTLTSLISEKKEKFAELIVTNDVGSTYIFDALYNQIDPVKIQQLHQQNDTSLEIPVIDNVHFTAVTSRTLPCQLVQPDRLVVRLVNEDELRFETPQPPKPDEKLTSFNRFHNPKSIFHIYETNNISSASAQVLQKICSGQM